MNSVASPPLGGTRSLLLSLAPSLVPSERRVVQVCIDDTASVVDMSVADLARRAEVSPATVVRACQRMGFGGFQRLRELLIRDQGARSFAGSGAGRGIVDPAGWAGSAGSTGRAGSSAGSGSGSAVPDDALSVAAGEPSSHPVAQVFDRAMAGIHGALGALDFSEFDAAAAAIRGCARLLVVGNGASLAAAQSVALHFLSSGKVCENPVDIVTQHIAAKLLRPGDVCLAVSDSGMNHFTLRAARLAAENGATVVAITSYARSDLAGVATHALVAGADFHSWNDSTVIGNIVQMLLLSALHAASLGVLPGSERARAEVLDEVRTMVEGSGSRATAHFGDR
ncbi:MurR/RpiR family transcriptional regulator [Leucobacter sp. CSA1]|uniref:MurR/RpiR family transcriptional regulator n=1 Tax=Leucobacter chromiisoli TaxID=2796471 RepID=A0A934UW11_9MICO|nr:MurR/RpiR family transcriptional regulator [Leucobacter chromiisoli]MBK0419447.1 MurR/RpiR family transcriptional regulator [Leucobacter chromiisoli]